VSRMNPKKKISYGGAKKTSCMSAGNTGRKNALGSKSKKGDGTGRIKITYARRGKQNGAGVGKEKGRSLLQVTVHCGGRGGRNLGTERKKLKRTT